MEKIQRPRRFSPQNEGTKKDVTCGSAPYPLFDNAQVIGKTQAEAKAYLEDVGLEFRVVMQDGEPLGVIANWLPKRINVAVTEGVVTAIINNG